MTSGPQIPAQPPLLAMLRLAERVYVQAIRAALSDAEFDDLPPRGIRVVVGLQRRGSSVRELSRGLGVTSQAASQLLDVLVARGYVERSPDLSDRRRIIVTLTERGRAAARIVADAAREVDSRLESVTSATERDVLRAGLAALASLGEEPPGAAPLP